MRYCIQSLDQSRSFPAGDPFLSGAVASASANVLITGGACYSNEPRFAAILVELDLECLGVHTGETDGEEGSNVLGFARYRNGNEAPTSLIELVCQKNTYAAAITAARTVFELAGFTVVVCSDEAGRIVDRLVRPKYNSALRFLDEGRASRADIDLTCRLGLGYPDGPIERVFRGDLKRHHEISMALFQVYGTAAFAPARRAVVARQRQDR